MCKANLCYHKQTFSKFFSFCLVNKPGKATGEEVRYSYLFSRPGPFEYGDDVDAGRSQGFEGFSLEERIYTKIVGFCSLKTCCVGIDVRLVKWTMSWFVITQGCTRSLLMYPGVLQPEVIPWKESKDSP